MICGVSSLLLLYINWRKISQLTISYVESHMRSLVCFTPGRKTRREWLRVALFYFRSNTSSHFILEVGNVQPMTQRRFHIFYLKKTKFLILCAAILFMNLLVQVATVRLDKTYILIELFLPEFLNIQVH